jgi:uncharacterized protein YndB with AHSA1/START domain
MELDSDRLYVFPVPPEQVWRALAATDDYRRWWPWLTAFEADGLFAGSRWRCTVRPPLPYSLRFTLDLDDVVPPALVTAHVTGDIAGLARVDLADHDEGTEVRLTSALTPSNRAFAIVAALARPVVHRGHDWVLDTGARQFARRAIDTSSATGSNPGRDASHPGMTISEAGRNGA